jgi:hypothetical protein
MSPLHLELLAPMLVAIILILTVGGVILLRPIASKLGLLLEAMARERNEPRTAVELERIRDLLETMNGRLSLLEERQDFTEALLADPDRRSRRLKGADVEERAREAREHPEAQNLNR